VSSIIHMLCPGTRTTMLGGENKLMDANCR
jgi:hypothetical protein